jgi:Lipocalin-like domain
MKPGMIAAALFALALSAGAVAAQPAKSLGEQIVGTWNFVVAEVTAPDGKKSFPFGETPKGILIFTPDGRFAQIHVAGDVPKIASNNRLTGKPEEYAEIMRRSLSLFGTWTVDEANRTVTYRIVSSSFPNWQARRRPAPSTSSPRTSSSTPIPASPAAAAAIFTGG